MYTTSPYSLNWLYTDYIRPRVKDPNFMKDELELIQARSDENPYFPKAEFERKRKTMDKRRFNMIYGGQFHKLEGLVYDCFNEDIHVVPPKTLPPRTVVVAGVDWGYTNPAAISVLAVTPEDGVYMVAEYYKTQQTIDKIVEAAKQLKEVWGIERFYCDPSSPANIQEFNKARLTAIPADNDIRAGVDATYELIAQDRFHVFEGRCKHVLDEFSIYHYPNDEILTPDKDSKDRLPVKQWDHILDGIRYVCLALKRSSTFNLKAPIEGGKVPVKSNMHVVDKVLLEATEEYDW